MFGFIRRYMSLAIGWFRRIEPTPFRHKEPAPSRNLFVPLPPLPNETPVDLRDEPRVVFPDWSSIPSMDAATVKPCVIERKERAPSIRPLKGDIEEIANKVLDTFSHTRRDESKIYRRIDLNAHDDLWACDYHLMDKDIPERMKPGARFLLKDDNDHTGAVWPIDIAGICHLPHGGGWLTERVSTVTAQDVRGKVTMTPQRMVVLSSGHLTDESWDAHRFIYGMVNRHWKYIQPRVLIDRDTGSYKHSLVTVRNVHESDEWGIPKIVIGQALALSARYSWHIAFGSEDGPRLLLPTNPSGCLALFKDRSSDGKNRRTALRHWVENFYREDEAEYSDLVYVRDHLRGATTFLWRGLQCEIMVSQYDLEKNELFKNQAAEWRSQRKHNRVRLRRKA